MVLSGAAVSYRHPPGYIKFLNAFNSGACSKTWSGLVSFGWYYFTGLWTFPLVWYFLSHFHYVFFFF